MYICIFRCQSLEDYESFFYAIECIKKKRKKDYFGIISVKHNDAITDFTIEVTQSENTLIAQMMWPDVYKTAPGTDTGNL